MDSLEERAVIARWVRHVLDQAGETKARLLAGARSPCHIVVYWAENCAPDIVVCQVDLQLTKGVMEIVKQWGSTEWKAKKRPLGQIALADPKAEKFLAKQIKNAANHFRRREKLHLERAAKAEEVLLA